MAGFIDLHVHLFDGLMHYGVDVDSTCLARGVTTALDAGIELLPDLPGFCKFAPGGLRTRLRVAQPLAMGLVPGQETDIGLGELARPCDGDVASATRIIEPTVTGSWESKCDSPIFSRLVEKMSWEHSCAPRGCRRSRLAIDGPFSVLKFANRAHTGRASARRYSDALFPWTRLATVYPHL